MVPVLVKMDRWVVFYQENIVQINFSSALPELSCNYSKWTLTVLTWELINIANQEVVTKEKETVIFSFLLLWFMVGCFQVFWGSSTTFRICENPNCAVK